MRRRAKLWSPVSTYSIHAQPSPMRSFARRRLRRPTFLQIRDKVTGSPIEASIVVTCVEEAEDTIVSQITKEFDHEESAKTWYTQVSTKCLARGKKLELTTAGTSFMGINGATYRVEATHKGYRALSVTFTVDEAARTNRRILLVDEKTCEKQTGEIVGCAGGRS